MRIVLLGLALLLLSLPVAAGEPCNAGSVDCCALEGTATGDIDTAGYGVCAYAPTTDVAPNDLAIHSAACYAQGTQTSSNLILAGGLAPKTITVVTPADTVGDTVAATVNSVILAALTEGVDWDCAALTTAQCATNLAAAITGQTGSGVVCVGVAAVVYCQPVDCDTWGLSYTLSDGVAMTYSGGTNGAILIYGDGAGVPDLGFAEDPDTGFRWQSSGVFNLMSNGANQLQITTATINFWDNYAYSSAGMFKLGGPMTTSHALGVGAVGIANELEVDGVAYFDSTVWFYGAAVVDTTGYLQLRDTSQLYLGTGNDYWFIYDNTGTALELWSTDVDGSLTDGKIFSVQGGTDDVAFTGEVASGGSNTKGALTNIKTKTESVTFANDAAKTTAGGIIPDGAMIMGVSGRVTTLLTGCTATSIGDGTDIDLFKGGLALAVGSTFTNADATASYSTMSQGNMPSIGAAEITVSAIGGNCTAGVIALTVHYIDVTAATAN